MVPIVSQARQHVLLASKVLNFLLLRHRLKVVRPIGLPRWSGWAVCRPSTDSRAVCAMHGRLLAFGSWSFSSGSTCLPLIGSLTNRHLSKSAIAQLASPTVAVEVCHSVSTTYELVLTWLMPLSLSPKFLNFSRKILKRCWTLSISFHRRYRPSTVLTSSLTLWFVKAPLLNFGIG